jgi:predicted metal-dependent hydrolase
VFCFRRGGKVLRGEALIALDLPGGALQCRLRLSNRRRTLALRVSAAGEVVVNAPRRLATEEIERFLRQHADWISERLAAVRAEAFAWQEGAALPLRGETLRLHIAESGGGALLRGEQLVCGGSAERIAAEVLRWYQRQARAILLERLAYHADRAGLAPPPMRLSNARTRWGSLSAKGVVSLNWRLIKASPEELDYVICHELAHFRQRNHSPAFWREVGLLFPDYLRVRAKLRQQGRLYFAF